LIDGLEQNFEAEDDMSCKHGNWEPCEECEAEDALYASGVANGKKQAKDELFDAETTQFLVDVLTAAGLLYHGKTDKGLAQRISDGQARL
jgi:hypothetical protein